MERVPEAAIFWDVSCFNQCGWFRGGLAEQEWEQPWPQKYGERIGL